ncbi:MAG: hypothetical protein GXO72_04970 [Caldiserica bacterium]|nr:hypothetical protein [Caldisericota bacterium]
MSEPIPGLIVRTKAGNVKVLCRDCLRVSEYEEVVNSFKSVISSRCVKCDRLVILNSPEPEYQLQPSGS